MNILCIDDEGHSKRWINSQDTIINVATYEQATKELQKQKFNIVDINLDIKDTFDGCDIIRYIVKEQIHIDKIYIHSENFEKRNNMIKLLKKFIDVEIQYY